MLVNRWRTPYVQIWPNKHGIDPKFLAKLSTRLERWKALGSELVAGRG